MAVLTIRPNAAGNQQGWDAEGGDFARISEVTSDGDTTRLYTPTDNRVATFKLENRTSESGTINSVTVFINTRGLDPVSNTVQVALRTSATDYFSADKTYNNTAYHLESNVWSTNPNTSAAWTWAEIDALEAGMKRITGGGQAVTQVYVEVDYTSATVEQEGYRFRNDDGSESAASWLAAQDTNITRTRSINTRLRILLNTTGNLSTEQFRLDYKLSSAGSYIAVPISSTSYSAELTTGGTASASAENQPSEGSDEAFDGSASTKWLCFVSTATLQYRFGSSAQHAVTKYAITSANDEITRDPTNWTLDGSNNGTSWTTVDTRTGEAFATRLLRKEYTFTNTTAYEYYRLNITLNNGAGSTQLAELELYSSITEPIFISPSTNITASGQNTTVQLTAPSGKTTSDFTVGRIQDDENPADTIDIVVDDYSELEWCLSAQSTALDNNIYYFRVTINGTAISTYTLTPQWTIGTAGAVAKRLMLLGVG